MMENDKEQFTRVLASVSLPVIPAEPTIYDLRSMDHDWIVLGANTIPHLRMIAYSLGESYVHPGHSNICKIYNLPYISLFVSPKIECWDPGLNDYSGWECYLVSIGDPKLTAPAGYSNLHPADNNWAADGTPIIRETVVCRLYNRYSYGKPAGYGVDPSKPGTIFRPGKWARDLLDNLKYAYEVHNSREQVRIESERIALLNKLLIGRDV